eukprot:COSAG04_NODE_1000_length_8841_cov_5.219973_2_plen_373_part_00
MRPAAPHPTPPALSHQRRACAAAALAERDDGYGAPLHRAAECKQPEGAAADGVRLLLAAGADATALDGSEWTALHRAAFYGPDDPSLAGLLLGAGCDPTAETGNGQTALDWAKEKNKPRMAALLEAARADPEATLAPFRAEVAALRQLVGNVGLEHGLTAIVDGHDAVALLEARTDKALPEGTRVCVAGRGRGAYVSFERKRIGANEHTIAFDSGETVTLKLKKETWTVNEAEMDAMDPPLSITVMTLEQGPFTRWFGGLGSLQAPAGSLVMYAAGQGQLAADGAERGRNGVFTAALLEHLGTPGLSLERLAVNVRNAVKAAAGEGQAPESINRLNVVGLCLVPAGVGLQLSEGVPPGGGFEPEPEPECDDV